MINRWGRAWRWAGGGFLGVVGLVGTSLVSGLAPVAPDLVPVASMSTARGALDPAPIRAGWSRMRLTPTIGAATTDAEKGGFNQIPLAGYGNRQGAPATGIHDELWVKAVAFATRSATGVMVSADALIVPREVADRAVEALGRSRGLGRGQVYFSATHTHCSLGGWGQRFVGEAFAGPYDPAVPTWFANQVARSVEAALDDLQPARLGAGAFEAPEFIRNRLDRGGVVDPEFSLLVVQQADGDRAVLGSYSAHATILGGDVLEFSGDYPGAWARAMEASGVGWAAFFAGGVGSQSPVAPKGGFEGVEAMGRSLAARSLDRVARIPLMEEVPFQTELVALTLPEVQVRVSDNVRLRPWVARQLMPPLSETTILQAFRFGNCVWLSTPCDYSAELALDLKAAALARGVDAVVTSFNGDYIGYVIPGRHYHRDGYEPRVMNFYGPRVPEVFAKVLARLATRADPR
ncbi:MAG: neutral/alkaline non-lysosomal ceramidase N-terminal domain-containing protein [Limisphaerales bacterium]